ncbi:MAG: hypothetical protein O7F08_11630 [Deltaproteobacteria bacterium]|nr:hypothetical protein [Deltaproteobacteria bacterium]
MFREPVLDDDERRGRIVVGGFDAALRQYHEVLPVRVMHSWLEQSSTMRFSPNPPDIIRTGLDLAMLYEVSGCGSSVFGKAVAWLFAVAVLPCSVAAQTAQNWVEVRTPHFILLSNTDSRRARNVALEFEQARELFRVAISPDAGQDTALPVVIFAVRNRADLRVLLPGLEGELPIGVFRRSPDQHSIAVRLDEPSEQRFHAVYHEYHHLLFRSAVARAPVWLTEGLAEFWSTMETRRDGSMEIGRPNPRHLRALRLGSMMPLARLLEKNPRRPEQLSRRAASPAHRSG